MPTIQSYLIEPIWKQFSALLPERKVEHPLGCYKSRIPDRIVFEKLLQVLVFGCAYHRIADESCSDTTLRRRRDEWIDAGVREKLREMALAAYDRAVCLELADWNCPVLADRFAWLMSEESAVGYGRDISDYRPTG